MLISRRVYIAGAISSRSYEEAWRSFYRAERFLRGAKFEPVNPMFYCFRHWSYLRCMAVCVDLLQTCDVIYVLKGSENSKGVALELRVAKSCGIFVVYSTIDF